MKRKILPLFLVPVVLLMTGCLGAGGTDRQVLLSGGSWPGISTYEDRIYMASGPQVYAIDENGLDIWSYPTEQERGRTFFAPPAVTDELVVVGDYVDAIVGLDPENGQERWRFQNEQFRLVSGATIEGDLVYAPSSINGSLYAFDVDATGEAEPVWEFSADRGIWSKPVVADGLVYVTSLDKHVYAVDAESGELAWQFPSEGAEEEERVAAMVSTPVYHDGVLYFSDLDRVLYALNVDDQTVEWRYELPTWMWGTPIIIDTEDLLVAGDLSGRVFALNLEDGSEAWVQDTDGRVVGGPTLAEDTEEGQPIIYIASEDTKLYPLDVTTGDPLDTPITVNNTFSRRLLIIPLDEEIRPSPVFSSPVVFNDLLLVGLHQGNFPLKAYQQDSLVQEWAFSPNQ